MHADDLFRTLGGRGQLGDRDGAGIGGQDGGFRANLVEGRKHLGFHVQAFDHGFDHQIADRQIRQIAGGGDATQGIGLVLLGDFFFLDQAIQAFADAGEAFFESGGLDIAEVDPIARGPRPTWAMPWAHGSGADHAYGLNIGHRKLLMRVFKLVEVFEKLEVENISRDSRNVERGPLVKAR